MAWGTAASFVQLYMPRAHPRRSSKVSNAFSRAEPSRSKKLPPTRSGSTELRTQPMVPLSTTVSTQRSERRISVRLPLKVRGRDARGFAFEEDTSSENLCRNGAAFVTRFDVAIGSDLEIHIPLSHYASRRVYSSARARKYCRLPGASNNHANFATHDRVIHVADSRAQAEKLVG